MKRYGKLGDLDPEALQAIQPEWITDLAWASESTAEIHSRLSLGKPSATDEMNTFWLMSNLFHQYNQIEPEGHTLHVPYSILLNTQIQIVGPKITKMLKLFRQKVDLEYFHILKFELDLI